MGRTKGAKGKKNKACKQLPLNDVDKIKINLDFDKEVPLSEEAKELVKKGLAEAKDGKIEKIPCISKEQEERRAKLKLVMKEINKVIPDAVQFANTVEEKKRISFGYKCLDTLTGGGILCGNFNVIWGSKGCGKTTIAYKMIGKAQKEGKIVAYLDIERSYDPRWAKKYGVDVDDLTYVACKTAEQVFDTILKLCREKVVDLIVLDSIQGLTPKGENYEGKGEKEKSVEDDTMALLARKLSQFFRMAAAPVSEAKCAVLLIGQARMDLGSFIKMETLSGGHALMHNSRLILRVRRGQGVDAPSEKRPTGEKDKNGKPKMEDFKLGFDLVVHVNKAQIQGCTEGDEIHVPFYFEDGIHE